MKQELEFEKYRKRGAYHWKNYFGSLFSIDSFLRGRYDMVIRHLKRSGITDSSSLLEVGCGDGALSGLIYKTFHCQITGIEPSPDGIRFSREMFEAYGFKGTFEISEGYQFKYPDNHFDFIVLADVIEHLQYPDLMLKEMKRVLKPGGKAIVTTPLRTSEHPEDVMHVQEFFADELVQLCKTNFGEPLEMEYSHPVGWYELYTYGKKKNRSLIRLYCRICDKVLGRNVFLQTNTNSRWVNFKQQAIVLKKGN
jgi:ubiquinone/menaquinone biosynthesis C-methylase UbiE